MFFLFLFFFFPLHAGSGLSCANSDVSHIVTTDDTEGNVIVLPQLTDARRTQIALRVEQMSWESLRQHYRNKSADFSHVSLMDQAELLFFRQCVKSRYEEFRLWIALTTDSKED